MDKIFGEVDAVEAGEQEGEVDKVEALSHSHVEHHEKIDEKDTTTVVKNSRLDV